MKKRILLLVIYLIGCFFSYKYTKFNMTRDKYDKKCTKEDTTFSILVSTFSWLNVAAMGIIHGLNSIENN